jgi:pyruvate,water dikinase
VSLSGKVEAAPIVLSLASADASLERAGGKGRSLAVLAIAELPVPDGFLVSTDAYRGFAEANGLQASITHILTDSIAEQAASSDAASSKIQALFDGASLSPGTAAVIREAYGGLGVNDPAVAVRSSATAEDLPDLSFAGQQDTYLNVRGEAALLDAVRRCWASLWTARAIDYRRRMEIDDQALAMGVVVQLMIEAEVSGILFTANPATGDRSELVINASFGLGEAVVGGLVTPDTYLLDRSKLDDADSGLKQTQIGAKTEMIVSAGDQGTVTQPVPESKRGNASLSAESLRELASLSLRAERLFDGVPQDIEWAIADGTCWLLQSRPITNLPAAPLDVTWDPPAPGVKLIRRQVVENMPDPLSPLFADLYLTEGLDAGLDEMAADLGLPFDIDEFIDRPMFLTVNGFAYCLASYRVSWRLFRQIPKILFWYVKALPALLRNLVPLWRDGALPRYLATVDDWKVVDRHVATKGELLTGVRALAAADARYWYSVAMVMGAAKITDGLLNVFLTSRLVPGLLTSGVFLRGFESKTIEAQQQLEAIARSVNSERSEGSVSLRDLVIATPASELLDRLSHHPGGETLVSDIQAYLDAYGHQIYTLDFVQATQAEEPLPVLLSLKALVGDGGYDTPARQAAMVEQRRLQVQATLEALGPVRRWLFRKFLGWAQDYGPNREEALFYIGAAWPTLRHLALELGQRLVEDGTLSRPEDVFYLERRELEAACSARESNETAPEFAQQAEQRRALRDARMQLHPPGMVPEKGRWKVGFINLSFLETQKRNAEDSNTLAGFPVSPGQVTGAASVILTPADFANMQPDTILVCPTTTPAWTPLFTQALGLVTDIGGILAHGSIVAREYGIPAVMGTGNVTKRIVSGQRISVDGDTGTVRILD